MTWPKTELRMSPSKSQQHAQMDDPNSKLYDPQEPKITQESKDNQMMKIRVLKSSDTVVFGNRRRVKMASSS